MAAHALALRKKLRRVIGVIMGLDYPKFFPGTSKKTKIILKSTVAHGDLTSSY
jgi:hypothetical protein